MLGNGLKGQEEQYHTEPEAGAKIDNPFNEPSNPL